MKDHLKFNMTDNSGNWGHSMNSRVKVNEPCRRFNKGKCKFGQSCKYKHRCNVPSCGKFSHGAHICRKCQGVTTNDNQDFHRDNGAHAVAVETPKRN